MWIIYKQINFEKSKYIFLPEIYIPKNSEEKLENKYVPEILTYMPNPPKSGKKIFQNILSNFHKKIQIQKYIFWIGK